MKKNQYSIWNNWKCTRKTGAAAKQTFPDSPSGGEHEERQMRSIWSAGEQLAINSNMKRASINECDREAGIFILRRFTSRRRARSAANAEHLV